MGLVNLEWYCEFIWEGYEVANSYMTMEALVSSLGLTESNWETSKDFLG